jgi:hypothetical protein
MAFLPALIFYDLANWDALFGGRILTPKFKEVSIDFCFVLFSVRES